MGHTVFNCEVCGTTQCTLDVCRNCGEFIQDDMGHMCPAGRVLRLAEALKHAINEIREHNGEYHHTTSEETIKSWESLL